jgi:hypothetical protein
VSGFLVGDRTLDRAEMRTVTVVPGTRVMRCVPRL